MLYGEPNLNEGKDWSETDLFGGRPGGLINQSEDLQTGLCSEGGWVAK
jgi:hypothetical protein